ncbi:phage protein [Proteus mirabilis]|uniref:Phage protein n=1 Tax=Proteus mirabilis TaxID=584 RepID=A0A379FFY0_PROMI|nr:phage protein [Proteus mirabilis]
MQGASALKEEIKHRVPILKETVPHRRKGTIKRNIRSKTKVQRNGQVKTRIWVKSLSGKKVSAFKQATGKSAALNPNDPFLLVVCRVWYRQDARTTVYAPQL